MRMRRRNNLAPRMEACESVWIHDPEALRGNWRGTLRWQYLALILDF